MNKIRSYKSFLPWDLKARPGSVDANTALSVLVFAVAYYIAYRYLTFPFGESPSPLWSPDAVLLSALLLSPTRNWLLYILVSLPIRLLTPSQGDIPLWFLMAVSLNDFFKALFTAAIMRRFVKCSPRLAGFRNFSMFFACAVVLAPFLSALAGAAAHSVLRGGPYWEYWRQWFLGDALVSLVLTPTILYWLTGGIKSLRNASGARWAEALCLAVGLVVIGVKVLGGDFGGLGGSPGLLYVPMPFLVWAAVRFGPRGASTSLTLVAFISIWYAVANRGPFSGQSTQQDILSLQLFLIVVSSPLLFLAALVQERRDAEASLRDSERRYRQMFEQNRAVQWLIDPSSGQIISANAAASEFYGYSLKQLEGMNVTQINILPPDKVAEELRRAVTKECNYFNFRHRLASGEIRDVEVHSSPAVLGGRLLLYGIIHDVTERRRTEERFRRFFDLPLVGMAITSPDRCFILVNQKLCDMLGYSAQELIGMSWVDVTHPRDIEENVRLLQRTIAGEAEGYTMDKVFIHRNGKLVYTSISARCVRKDDGAVDHLVLIVQDITERTHAEAALRESEQRFSTAFHSSPQPMSITTINEGLYVDVNQRFLEVSGYKRGEVIGQTSLALKVWDSAAARTDVIEPLREFGRIRNVETRFHTRTGEVRTWLSSAELIELGGKPCILMASSDITERKQAEAALGESESKNRAVLKAIPDLMFLQSKDGVYLDYHAKDPGNLLAPPESFIGKTMREVLPVKIAEQFEDCFRQALLSDEPVIAEYSLPIGGADRYYECRIVACGSDRVLSIVRDITQRKHAQASLEQALAEVRRLKDQLYAENVYLQEAIMVAHDFGEMVGDSEPLNRVLQHAEQVAPLDTTVLILGETGTGKELLAHAIHNLSKRKDRPLIRVNCATLPSELIEDELFGHEKGAFTGAVAKRLGRFEIASGGTIFLDEIGELPLDLQVKLLRVIQESEFERLGSSRTIKVDVRLIAATNRDLGAAVAAGAFRADLFYRLSVYPIKLPPLRDRREDIPRLVMHFVKQMNAKLGKQIHSIPQRSLDALMNYSWPGNIRELRNVIERAAIITPADTLVLRDSLDGGPLGQPINPLDGPQSGIFDWAQTLEENERNLILRTLDRTGGRIEGPAGAATLLAIHPSTLRSRMRKLGIVRSRFMIPGGGN